MRDLRKSGGSLLILITGLLWGAIGFFVKQLEARGSTPELTAFLRMGFAFLLFLPVCLAKGGLKSLRLSGRDLAFCALQGLVCYGLFNMLYSLAVTLVGVSVGAVLLYTAPVFTLLFSLAFFHEPFTLRKLAAIGLNVLGCVLTATGGRLDAGSLSLAGVLAGVGAGFCYGLTPILGRFGSGRMDPMPMTLYSYLFASLFLLLRLRPWTGELQLSGGLLLWGLLFALIPTVLAYFLYYRGLQRVREPSRVPVIASVETVAAAVLGTLVFHDRLGTAGILGILLVLCSIAVLSLPGGGGGGAGEPDR